MKLGGLAIKKQAQTWLGAVNERQQQHAVTPTNVAFNAAERSAPVTSGGQLGVGLLQQLFGESAGIVGAFLPFVAGPIKNATGIDVMAPLRIGYGGDPEATRQVQAAQGAMMTQQLVENTGALSAIGQAAGDTFDKYAPDWVKELVPFTGKSLPGLIATVPPDQLGLFISQVSQASPMVAQLFSQFVPGMITSFEPFMRQTLMQNNGKFDAELFNKNVGDFKRAYASGHFQRPGREVLPAQLAASAVQHTRETLGKGATMTQAANAAYVADTLQKAGLADTFGNGLALASQLGTDYFNNPEALNTKIQQLGDMAASANMSPAQVAQAAQVAREQGQDPLAYMQVMASSGRMANLYGTQVADRLTAPSTQIQTEMMKRFDLLGGAVSTDKRYQRAFQTALKSGRPEAMYRLLQTAEKDPRLLADIGPAENHAGRGSALFAQMQSRSPDFMQGMMVQTAQNEMRGLTPQLRRQLNRTMTHDRDKLTEAVRTGDYTQVGDRRLGAMLSRNPSVAAAAMSVDPSLVRQNQFQLRNPRMRRAPKPIQPEPLTRVGLPGPAPAEQQPAAPLK